MKLFRHILILLMVLPLMGNDGCNKSAPVARWTCSNGVRGAAGCGADGVGFLGALRLSWWFNPESPDDKDVLCQGSVTKIIHLSEGVGSVAEVVREIAGFTQVRTSEGKLQNFWPISSEDVLPDVTSCEDSRILALNDRTYERVPIAFVEGSAAENVSPYAVWGSGTREPGEDDVWTTLSASGRAFKFGKSGVESSMPVKFKNNRGRIDVSHEADPNTFQFSFYPAVQVQSGVLVVDSQNSQVTITSVLIK